MVIKPFLILVALVPFLAACAGNTGQSSELSGRLTISGSTALKPLADAGAAAFMKLHPGTHITVAGGGSVTGIKNVTQKKSDIGNSDIYADPELYPDPDLTDHIICVTPFVMIVHPDITVASLSKQQITDIFSTGKYTNWSEIDPHLNQPIHPIVRPATSGTRATFRKYVLEGGDEKGTYLNFDDTQQVLNQVASTPGAIGYIALSALKPTVRALEIDNYKPTPETIGNGKYYFWSYEHMYTMGNASPLLMAFLDFMTSSSMQTTAQKLSYIPTNEMKLSQAEKPSANTVLALSFFRESEVARRESHA